MSKPAMKWVYVSQHLSLVTVGKACEGQTKVANRTREIRPSGMKREASGNVAMGAGLRPTAKAVDLPPDPKVRAPDFYPDSHPEDEERQRCHSRLVVSSCGK